MIALVDLLAYVLAVLAWWLILTGSVALVALVYALGAWWRGRGRP